MKKLVFASILAAAFCGCWSPKSRSFDASGLYLSETGQLAAGKIHVDAIPEGTESAVIHYTEDTALLSPSTKTHDIDVILTGTNSVYHASSIVASICDAFVAVAPKIAETNANAPKGVTVLDAAMTNVAAAAASKAVPLAKSSASPAPSGDCPDCVDPDCPECFDK